MREGNYNHRTASEQKLRRHAQKQNITQQFQKLKTITRPTRVSLVAFAALAALTGAAPAHAQEALWSAEPDPESVAHEASHRVRYITGPSAMMLETGEGYVSQTQLLLTRAEYGVTDWFSVSASGIVPLWITPVFLDSSVNIYPHAWIELKFGGRLVGDLHASFGASFGAGYYLKFGPEGFATRPIVDRRSFLESTVGSRSSPSHGSRSPWTSGAECPLCEEM